MKFFHTFSKSVLLPAFLLLLCNFAMAQRAVKGKVTDSESGEPLIGASVSVVGTTRGASTDVDGNFVVDVPAGSTQIRVAYTGYAEQVVTLGASNVVDVALKPGSVLDEVVVIGYGAVKKADLTGSVGSVAEKDFNQGLISAPDQLIQGKTAGVQITNNSGQPGGASTIRIRGNSSIRAGNSPLFVVDGVQLTGASTKAGANLGDLGASSPSNPLNYLNPADIESMQVLKDASATAIYGARGANGVILITTKKGKSGQPTVTFNTSVGMSSILNKYDVLTADEYRATLNKYGEYTLKHDNKDEFPKDSITGRRLGDYGGNSDAFGEILRTGISQNHGISISGGTDAGNYRLGLNYQNQEGIIKENDLRRLSASLAGSYKFLESKKLGLDFNMIASQVKENGPAIATNSGFRGSLIGNALQWNPTDSIYEKDGSPVIVPKFGNFTNPVALLDAFQDKSNTVNIIASISPYYKITDNLTYRFFYSIDQGVGDRRAQLASWINVQGVEGKGLAGYQEKRIANQILTHTLNYNAALGSSINLNATLGYEYQKLTEKGVGITANTFLPRDFDYTNIFQNSDPTTRQIFSYANPDAELQSYFVRGIFNIRDKYLVTATFRADGSSKFGENKKYGYFPAVGVAWNLHQESFLENGPFETLKLRASWGQTGNSEFPAGSAIDRYFFNNSNGQPSTGLENVGNPDLTWETTTTINAGLDFGLMHGKIYGTVEYFNRNTTNLLFQFRNIQPAPLGRYWQNIDGNLINKGVELTLGAMLIDKDKMSWSIDGNITFLSNVIKNTNRIITYGEVFGQGSSGATIQRLEDGHPLNSFYTRHWLGLDTTGVSIYEGGSAETLGYHGDANPRMLYGLSTNFRLDKFSIGLAFNGAGGHMVYNNTKMSVIPITNLGTRNIDASLVDGSTIESTGNALKPSDRYLEKGDYLKLSNLTLGYNLGNLGKSIKNARIYLTGQNLLVFTKYSGFDPEVNTVNELEGLPSTGIEYIPYPSARTYTLGATFSF